MKRKGGWQNFYGSIGTNQNWKCTISPRTKWSSLWASRTDAAEWDEPVPGVESYGRVPNGRWIKIIWRYNGIGDGDLIFVITAYHMPHPPPGCG
ncbi:hypothetical protein FTUN_0568 [Frigoriglobus tundricola]|uniref:Uncharacterized protein n=1 Tax=Frigoriglobus tundricola TaxID=2774151 RepID=A0A6M5YII1_9BACT|nr:hypothetical protein FTUN_0568 [Frigoriglobus tundricola]